MDLNLIQPIIVLIFFSINYFLRINLLHCMSCLKAKCRKVDLWHEKKKNSPIFMKKNYFTQKHSL